MSTTSSRPSSPSQADLQPEELAALLRDQTFANRLAHGFSNDPTATIALRLFQFASEGIQHHEDELARYRTEQNDVFDYAVQNQSFRRIVGANVRLYRERDHPYAQSFNPPSPISSLPNSPADI